MTSILQPGDEIAYTVTYLEMDERPRAPVPPRPVNLNTALVCATDPPADYFLYLYRAVGAEYEWTDWIDRPREELNGFLSNSDVFLYTLLVEGWPGGFFMLDSSTPGTCDLAYFGLVPEAIGKGLGMWLLSTAVDAGWEIPGAEKMTVNTNTLDHPRALGLYQKVGFQAVKRVEAKRKLSRERKEN